MNSRASRNCPRMVRLDVLCMKKTKRLGVAAVMIVVVGFVGLNILAYYHARSMMSFRSGDDRTSKPEALSVCQKAEVLLTGANVPRPSGHRTPSDLAADCRKLKISVSDNITLDAWYCDRDQSTPLVILFHGYSAEKTSLLIEAHELIKLGASVMLVGFRGSGDRQNPAQPSAYANRTMSAPSSGMRRRTSHTQAPFSLARA